MAKTISPKFKKGRVTDSPKSMEDPKGHYKAGGK